MQHIFESTDSKSWTSEIKKHANVQHKHEWLKIRPDKLASRNMWIKHADQFGDAVVVAEASVYDCGRGVYSLRSFEKGDYLPFNVPGISLSHAKHNELEEFLVQCTLRERNDWTAQQVEEVVAILKTKWNIQLVCRNGVRVPYWDQLYDSFVIYRFGTTKHMLFWNVYTWTGFIHAHGTTPQNAGLFINEPSHFERFYNRVAEKTQLSVANVEYDVVYDDDRNDTCRIRFRAVRKIRRWDTILLNYGIHYGRSYKSASVRSEPGTFTSPGVDEERFVHLVHELWS